MLTENRKYLNDYVSKEETEWSNFWYDQANVNSDKRVLLVGDSVARQIRRTLSTKLQCPVDLFGTSASLRDRMFWDQWECFFVNGLYRYDIIYVWIGSHSRISEDGVSAYGDYDYERFKVDYATLVEKCCKLSPKVVILPSMHRFKERKFNVVMESFRRKMGVKPKENPDSELNIVVEKKNEVIRSIAEEKGLPYCDVDSVMLKSQYWHKDTIHYYPEANSYICNLLMEIIV